MARRKIIASGDEAALLLSPETLDQMGVQIGDEVDLSEWPKGFARMVL